MAKLPSSSSSSASSSSPSPSPSKMNTTNKQRQQQTKKKINKKKHHRQPPQHEKPRPHHPNNNKFTPDDLTSLISRLSSATNLSFRFLSDNDLLLRPSQTLTLDSSLFSAALSLSSLHSLLSSPLPIPTPSNPTSNNDDYWFRRFLASSNSDSDPRWLETFRMSRPSFLLLLNTLSPSLSVDSAFPPDHKLGATLFRLAHAAPFRSVARRFGLDGPAPACRAFYEICRAVADQLGHLFELYSDRKRVLQGFGWMSLPGCCGVVGFNRFFVEGKADPGKDGSSVIVQAVVDSEGRFLDVSAGWTGSMRPSQILPRTKLFSFHAKELLSNATPCVEVTSGCGGDVDSGDGIAGGPRYLLGDSCCPLLPWLLTPFRDSDTPGCNAFSDVHARAMELVTKAFGGLRGRWRLLLARWKEDCIDALPFVIVTSCLLHNFLFKCSEPLPLDIGESDREQRFTEFEGEADEYGEKVRQALASHLSVRVSHK